MAFFSLQALLQTTIIQLSKHPSCPPPQVPQVPTVPISIGPDFNILGVLQSFPKGSAAGPSGLRIQHRQDAASIPLPTSICSSLRDLVNLLSSGKAPTSVSTFLAGGSLTALNKFKPGCLPDVRPIAVGEALRRLTGKCLCSLIKYKASEFFQPLQFGVACASGSEKVVHGLRACMDKHWEDDDLAVVKVDMRNAFNMVSRQAILDECALHFPELFYLGPHGAMLLIPCCGTPWVASSQKQVSNKVTPWAPCSLHWFYRRS